MVDATSLESLRKTAAVWGIEKRMLRGRPYGFVDYGNPHGHRPFLSLPLIIQPKYKGYKKSRQAGVSENSVTEALFFLDSYPLNVVYTFPSPIQVEDFSKTRVDAALEDSCGGVLRSMRGYPQNVTLKRLGKGHLFLRSATNERLGEGIDADMVVFDEIDRMRRNVGVAFKESLSASKWGFVREVSTPTLPGRGVDELWQKSNQMLWLVRCPDCGKEQHLTFPENIVELKPVPAYEKIIPKGSYDFACKHCGSRRLDRWNGRWVPSNPEIEDYVCFQINQLMCCWISADEIMQKKKDYRFPQLFYNYVLGETYAADNILLSETDLLRCIDPSLLSWGGKSSRFTRISVGIDWGTLNWVVVMGMTATGRRELLALKCVEDSTEPLHSAKEIAKFIAPFEPNIIVADWGYGKDRVTYLLEQFPGRTYGCTYANNSKLIEPGFQDGTHTVTVDRTGWLKTMCNRFREVQVLTPSPHRIPMLDVYHKHMSSLVVMMEEDGEGRITERVDHVGDDHFAHATGYALMGLDRGAGVSTFSFDFV